ncbi:MAG: O-antigen ligase family protein [Acidimicrobiales bacterium]|jgi:hypothetical protein|nr:O-antigen ligase family protein [Acidimicrobiales bacterium]
MSRVADRTAAASSLFFLGLVAYAWVAIHHVMVAAVIAALVVMAATYVVRPAIVLLLPLPGAFLSWRLGSAQTAVGQGVSLGDALLLVATVAALLVIGLESRPLRRLLGACAVYEASLLVAVLASPTRAGMVEWLHRADLVAGSLIVGAAIAQSGAAGRAFRAYLIAASVIGASAVVLATKTGFSGGAWPFGLQKNFAGDLLMLALLMTLLPPEHLPISARTLTTLQGLIGVGLLATQSRGAMLGLAAGAFVWAVTNGRMSKRSPLLYLGAAVMLAVTITSLRTDSHKAKLSTLQTRRAFQAEAKAVWRASPIVGKGLKFFTTSGTTLQSDPHSVMWLTLAESGVVGLAGLIALLAGAITTLYRVRDPITKVAIALVVARFAHGLFDIYWVGGSQAVPWIVAGAAVVLAARSSRADVDAVA